MICRRCTTRLLSALHPTPRTILTRTLATTTPTNPTIPPPPPPAASTTTSEAQHVTPTSAAPSTKSKGATSKSSLLAGTPLRGLDFIKNADPPLAREDHEYPPWLWTLLDEPSASTISSSSAAAAEGDIYAKSAKQRKIANRKAEKLKKLNPHASKHHVIVPLNEQTVDLQGEEERAALKKVLRKQRRDGIKETNYLKAMKK